MPQLSSPLLDDYNNTGIVSPALQRALDAVKQKLPQFGLPASPAAPDSATPRLQPPGGPIPTITRPPAAAPVPSYRVLTAQVPTAPQITRGPLAPPSSATDAAPMIQDPNAAQHQAERDRLIQNGSGLTENWNNISQSDHGPIVRGLLRAANIAGRVGDIAGTAFFPNITAQIPGTELHHNYLVKRATGAVNQDLAQAKENATTQETQQRTAGMPSAEEAEASRAAETRERNAQAANLEHPRPKDLTDKYLQENPNATAADLAKFLQQDYETRETARATAEAATRQPNEYADFKAGFLKQNPDATPDQIVAAYKKSQKTATETSAEDDQKYEALAAKKLRGEKLTPEEDADMKAYRDRKTVGQQVTNVYAGERADKAETSKQANELHKTLMTEFSNARNWITSRRPKKI